MRFAPGKGFFALLGLLALLGMSAVTAAPSPPSNDNNNDRPAIEIRACDSFSTGGRDVVILSPGQAKIMNAIVCDQPMVRRVLRLL